MPASPWEEQSPPSDTSEALRRILRAGREAAEGRKAVSATVRAAAEGRTRDELRSRFESESARLGVAPDPIWVEQKLDELEWSPAERIRKRGLGVAMAAGALGRMAQSRGPADVPEWMRLPAAATYTVWAPRSEKTAVELDAGAGAWLARALAEAPGRLGEQVALVEVWFAWEEEPGETGRVAVGLGSERLGCLSRDASQRLAASLRAAADRGARPRANAQLARAAHLRPPYLLVVEVPLPDAP